MWKQINRVKNNVFMLKRPPRERIKKEMKKDQEGKFGGVPNVEFRAGITTFVFVKSPIVCILGSESRRPLSQQLNGKAPIDNV